MAPELLTPFRDPGDVPPPPPPSDGPVADPLGVAVAGLYLGGMVIKPAEGEEEGDKWPKCTTWFWDPSTFF